MLGNPLWLMPCQFVGFLKEQEINPLPMHGFIREGKEQEQRRDFYWPETQSVPQM